MAQPRGPTSGRSEQVAKVLADLDKCDNFNLVEMEVKQFVLLGKPARVRTSTVSSPGIASEALQLGRTPWKLLLPHLLLKPPIRKEERLWKPLFL